MRVDQRPRRVGILVLEAVVDSKGRVRDVRVVRGPNNQWTKAQILAMQKWEFEPATLHGQPVDVLFSVTVNHFPMDTDP